MYSGDQNATLAQTAEAVFGFSQTDLESMLSQGKESVQVVADTLGIDIESPEDTADSDDNVHQKEVDLLRNVRDVSLLQGTLQNLLEAYGEKAIFGVVKQGLQVLFDVHDMLFLLHDEQAHLLVGKGGLEPPRDTLVKEMSISLETNHCLPVQSLLEKRPLDSFSQTKGADLTIIDRQIIRLLDKDGILCLPMIAHNKVVGVIVLAVEQTTRSGLFSRMNLLTMLAQQAALALYADGIRDAQSKVVQAERLAAASAIAKKVVHEVNNPLGIIKNYIKIFGLKLSKEDPAQEELKIISEELDRVALIVGRLSDFSEPAAKQTEPVDVNMLISDLVKITQESIMVNSKVKTHLALEPSLPKIFSEKDPLKQVLINLMKNAVEAMPKGGNLYISTDHFQRNNMSGAEEAPKTKDSVQIHVRDDGPGIPESVKASLFEPFVSSKKGQHAGLGLSVAYNIIKELNGKITYESNKQGTTFTIELPVGSKHRI